MLNSQGFTNSYFPSKIPRKSIVVLRRDGEPRLNMYGAKPETASDQTVFLDFVSTCKFLSGAKVKK
jgi:hypothetical protein